MVEQALVSVIVRTCGKTDVLKNALSSICNQTYTKIEAVIVEDGPNISESYIHEHFRNLTYQYHCTEKNIGRTKAGNQGLLLAKGKYINFLDEDDILLETHVEKLVTALDSSQAKVAYGIAEEH